MIPFLDLRLATTALRPYLDQAVERVMTAGRYIGGEEVDAFERDFAAYCGARQAVGVGNGLDALALMLRAFDIGPGDEVIVPSNTYIATWLAVSMVGARVVPAEPDPRTYNLDANRVEAAVSERTRAVLAVHLYGQSADLRSLGQVCERRGIALLTDSAQAHGVALGEAQAAAFSFYPSKNLGALGDGGAVVTNDARVAQKVRMLANYGSRQRYFHEARGVNSRLDPLQAALLGVKLRYLDEWNERRRAIAGRYGENLRGLPGLVLPYIVPGSKMVWHLFAARRNERDRWVAELAAQGVDTLIHYPQPPHLSGAYRDLGFKAGDFPIAETIANSELSLPLHPHLTDEQVERVIAAVQRTCARAAGAA